MIQNPVLPSQSSHFYKMLLQLLLLSMLVALASSCQNIRVQAKDGSVVIGRSMEFTQIDAAVNTYLVTEPAGTSYTMPSLPNCETPVTFTSLYKIARFRVYFDGSWANTTMGGINSAGISGSSLYFTACAKFPQPSTISGNECSKAIPQTNIVLWVLARYDSIWKLERDLKKKKGSPFPTVWDQGDIGLETIPIHYAFHDSKGRSLVLEYTADGMKYYENTVGVMTNSPEYSWHMTNLRLYPQARRADWPGFAWKYAREKYVASPFWTGSGLTGVPGDYTSPSRFIKAALSVNLILKPRTADEAVIQAIHLMNAADMPLGIAGPSADVADFTWWTTLHDIERKCVYFRGYSDPSYKKVCLNKTSDVESEQFIVDGDLEDGIFEMTEASITP